MEVKRTGGGFELIEFNDYYGYPCSLQQSSAAIYDQPGSGAIWFGRGEERMHLSYEQMEQLMPHIQAWMKSGSFEVTHNKANGFFGGEMEIPGYERRIDELFCAAFETNDHAMLDWVKIKFELNELRAKAATQQGVTADGDLFFERLERRRINKMKGNVGIIRNTHSDNCGNPPDLDLGACKYVSFFTNTHYEQFIFTVDHNNAYVLTAGEFNWQYLKFDELDRYNWAKDEMLWLSNCYQFYLTLIGMGKELRNEGN